MILQLLSPASSLYRKLSLIRHSFDNQNIFRPKDVSRFVFLCGANKSLDKISERRQALIDFSEKHLPHTQFFIAEKVFSLLSGEGHKGNLLDVEHDISEFADQIILVLESNSTYAELGAFSHEFLRKKLIVINDSKYKKSKSFVNLGPIKAIEEVNGVSHVLQYGMKENGIEVKDAIGDIFSELYELLKEPLKQKPVSLKKSDCNPAVCFTKNAVMLIHDLIYFTGPITRKEFTYVLQCIFSKQDFKLLNQNLGMLTAIGAIEWIQGIYKVDLIRSKLKTSFLRYDFDVNKVIATFRNYNQKNNPTRIYEIKEKNN